MSNSNLAIVFGPTLFGLQAATNGGVISDASYQNLVIYFVASVGFLFANVPPFISQGHRNDSEPLCGHIY